MKVVEEWEAANDRIDRVVAGAIGAPLSIFIAAPAEQILGEVVQGVRWTQIVSDLSGAAAGIMLIVLFAYLAMLVVGIPSYLALRHFKVWSIWSAAITGYFATIIAYFLLFLALAASVDRTSAVIADGFGSITLQQAILLAAFGSYGLVVGVTFWLISDFRFSRQ